MFTSKQFCARIDSSMTYWDFGNQFKDDGGNDYTEWYIVEMDDNGYFEIWVGREIDPARISDD